MYFSESCPIFYTKYTWEKGQILNVYIILNRKINDKLLLQIVSLKLNIVTIIQ